MSNFGSGWNYVGLSVQVEHPGTSMIYCVRIYSYDSTLEQKICLGGVILASTSDFISSAKYEVKIGKGMNGTIAKVLINQFFMTDREMLRF